jgi:hypothetical protein
MSSFRLTTSIAITLLSGCQYFVVGDGMFVVNGTLLPTARPCEVLLLSEKDEEIPFTRRKVQGQFEADFVVAPSARLYRVALLCGGPMKKVATVRYGTEVKPGQRVSLGEIAL